jgi:subtilisin family serine protease
MPDGYPFDATTPQEAQTAEIMRLWGRFVEPGPGNWREIGIRFFVRKDYLLVDHEHADLVRRVLGAELLPRRRRRPDNRLPEDWDDDDRYPLDPDPDRPDPDAPPDGTVAFGIEWVRLAPDTGVFRALDRIDKARRKGWLPGLPVSAVNPETVLGVAGNGPQLNTATRCPADEPTPVGPGMPLDPPIACDSRAGAGARVVVLDTGFDPDAAALPWMRGVHGDTDPGINLADRTLQPYAGHGTFIAGLVRSVAPAAEVIVRAAFPPLNTIYAATPLGLCFEGQLVTGIERALTVDHADIVSISAGTYTYSNAGLTLIRNYYEEHLRHHKGPVIVAAAGNDHTREPFYPAAEKWAVSAGSLAANLRGPAHYTNRGSWVDAYAPGENLVNAFPAGTLTYVEPPRTGGTGVFSGLAKWSGTSFATPVLAGLIAARMSRHGENGADAAQAVLARARRSALPGVGAVALPDYQHREGCCCPR